MAVADCPPPLLHSLAFARCPEMVGGKQGRHPHTFDLTWLVSAILKRLVGWGMKIPSSFVTA